MTDRQVASDPLAQGLEIVPLGGLREFGMNSMLISYGDTSIVVDAGVMFPDAELPGVDLIVPDLSYLSDLGRPVQALVLTHGHEDHIGGVPYLWPHLEGPVFGTALTLALVERRLDEHDLDGRSRLTRVRPRDRVRIGPFEIEFLRVTHSMPDCVAVAIHTPVGTLIHTGDFKIDQTPLDGEHFDLHRFAELGASGVLALFGDSTNVDRRGVSGSERDVIPAFEEIFTTSRGRIAVALFASSLYRIQLLVDLAAEFDRRVALVGRGVVENSEIAQRLGLLDIPTGVQIRESDVRAYPAGDVLVIATGSQGEPMAAMSRIAIDDHRHVTLDRGDTVVFSARAIPGNEKQIGRVMNHLAHRGAEVVHDGMKPVHVSGHGSSEELKLMLSLVRPKFFVPIHGEYRHLSQHARLAARVTDGGTEVVLLADGDILRLDAASARIVGRAPCGRVLIDGSRMGEVADEVLRDRRHLSNDGLVMPVVAINQQTGAIEGVPDIITRGFVIDERTESLTKEAGSIVTEILENASVEERTDVGMIRERLRVDLQRAVRRRSGRRPLVLPVVMEV